MIAATTAKKTIASEATGNSGVGTAVPFTTTVPIIKE